MEKGFKKFNIDIFKLKDGEHEYEFSVDDEFFSLFEESPVKKGTGIVKALLSKNSSLLQFNFDISGVLRLTCDRSLEEFDYEISDKRKLIFKYGPEELEMSDEIIMIEHGTLSINLAHYIYEYIILSVPFKKVHPKYRDMDDEESLVYSSVGEENESTEEDERKESSDPRWDALKTLKSNKEN